MLNMFKESVLIPVENFQSIDNKYRSKDDYVRSVYTGKWLRCHLNEQEYQLDNII